MTAQVPHIRVVITMSAFVMLGFAVVSAWVIGWSTDAVTKGNIIGTWQNFALLAVGFWIGSSSGSKAKSDGPVPRDAAEGAEQAADAAKDKADDLKDSAALARDFKEENGS